MIKPAMEKLTQFWGRLSKREQVIVMATGVVVLSTLFYVYPYEMQVKSIISLRTQIATAEKELLDLTAQMAEVKSRADDIKSGRMAVRGWDLGDEKGVVLFLEDASSEARRLGVDLVSVNPSKEIDKNDYKEVSMNLDLKGRYRDLAAYFKRLESLSRVVNIKKIRLESCPDSSSICAATIEAVTYLTK